MANSLPVNDPLGTDLHLDESGDLVVTMSGSLDMVTGQSNVAQSTRINLQTVPHTYLWGTTVGSRISDLVDQPLTEAVKEQIHSLVRDRLSRDPRILGIQGIELDDSQRDVLQVTVHAVVAALGAVQLPFRIGR